ncbi:flippase [Niallia sp. HCP3S3_B10]|uniref:flippase n=1 Tax=Niallia sp. HCP3S3_B10 TaxID=3438944 RepID=UPI003F887A1D
MNLKKNFIYNITYQVATLVIPLITIPYVSRILGKSGIGINAYTNSIVQYFILIGTIGISLYGSREIAYIRDNKNQLSITFWGIFSLKFITSIFSLILFFFFLMFVDSFKVIFLIQSILIIAAAIDISWLFIGLEDFKKTVVRNLLVKLLGVLCVFIFVKNPEDLWKYVFILTFSQFLGNLSLWFYLPKIVNVIKMSWNEIKKHFFPSIVLFIPQIAIQVYVILNKTMLGIFSNVDEVGIFENADKIVKVILAIVTSMGIVMLPRVSNTFAKGEMNQVKDYLYNSFNFSSYLSFPLAFGLASIAMNFAPWFFGEAFKNTGIIITIISPIIIFIAWSNVIGQQYLMPTKQVRKFTLSVLIGAIVNFVLNLYLIRLYHAVGAAIATLIAEILVTLVQFYLVRKALDITRMLKSTWKYFVSSLLMYISIRLLSPFITNEFKLLFQIVVGIVVYFSLLFLFKSTLNKMVFNNILKYIMHYRVKFRKL